MSKAGTYASHGSYKTFQPRLLSEPVKIIDERVTLLLADAMRYLGELNSYTQFTPDIDYYIRMHIAKEATTSTQIEGTNAELGEVLLSKEDIKTHTADQQDDWEEVQNYIKALNEAVDKLKTLPLARHLIEETHKTLLSGVRGFTRAPGEIRRIQNWVGPDNSDIRTATYIPPSPETLPSLLSDWERFWHNDDTQPTLIKIALLHYQFETIHPFLDGNGRLGRLLIILQLIDKGILGKPSLYISDYLERNRTLYYTSLDRVHVTGDYNQWLRFFLGAVLESAKNAVGTLRAIVSLREKYLERIDQNIGIRRQENARKLLLSLFAQPIVTVSQIREMLGSSTQTANQLANKFEEIGLLRESTGDKKNRQFVLGEYFDLFNKPRRERE